MAQNDLPSNSFLLTPTGFKKLQIVITDCGSAEEELRKLAADAPVTIPRAFVTTANGPVHMAATSTSVTLFGLVPSFRLSTHYSPHPTLPGKLTPVFRRAEGARDTLQLSCEFTPPPNMRVWFITHHITQPAVPGRSQYSRSFLVASCTDAGVPGLFKLPLPNIYEDCKLCLGNGTEGTIQPDHNAPLEKVFKNAFDIFYSSTWNGDLLQSISLDCTRAMFVMDGTTNKSVPGPTDWYRNNLQVSSAFYNSLPLANPHFANP